VGLANGNGVNVGAGITGEVVVIDRSVVAISK